MPSRRYDCVVMGAGVNGCAAALALGQSGLKVALVEQYQVGHHHGSSHGESRVIRYSYDHPDYVKMARLVYPMWAMLERESGERLYTRTGGIDLAPCGRLEIACCAESLTAEGIEFELLDAERIRARYPQFHIEDGTEGLYQADTGILHAAGCVRVMAHLARLRGVEVCQAIQLKEVADSGRGLSLNTNDGTIETDRLVLCGGGWMGPLLERLGVGLPLLVSQEQYAHFAVADRRRFSVGEFPVFIEYGGQGSGGIGFYGFPVFGEFGLKAAIHQSGPVVSAESRTFEANPGNLEDLCRRTGRLLGGEIGTVLDVVTCLYTSTPDQQFVLDYLETDRRIVYFAGCSGHSFKFAPLTGQIICDMVHDRSPQVDISRFSAARFNASRFAYL